MPTLPGSISPLAERVEGPPICALAGIAAAFFTSIRHACPMLFFRVFVVLVLSGHDSVA
jgi:hypothetical protein